MSCLALPVGGAGAKRGKSRFLAPLGMTLRVRVRAYCASRSFWNPPRVMFPWSLVNHNRLPFGVFSEMLILKRIKLFIFCELKKCSFCRG